MITYGADTTTDEVLDGLDSWSAPMGAASAAHRRVELGYLLGDIRWSEILGRRTYERVSYSSVFTSPGREHVVRREPDDLNATVPSKNLRV